jgi:hypothetical protein
VPATCKAKTSVASSQASDAILGPGTNTNAAISKQTKVTNQNRCRRLNRRIGNCGSGGWTATGFGSVVTARALLARFAVGASWAGILRFDMLNSRRLPI